MKYMRIADSGLSGQVSLNVRYLLWKKKVSPEHWQSWLAGHTSLDQITVRGLTDGSLSDDRVTSVQLRELARAFELEEEGETLRFSDLVRDGTKILMENLRFLIGNLGHGEKKVLAKELEIDPTTVSRWLNGTYEPQSPTLQQLMTHFGLPSKTDLRHDPIFLSAEPVSDAERRHWLFRRIDELSSSEIRELYPALRRMLEDR